MTCHFLSSIKYHRRFTLTLKCSVLNSNIVGFNQLICHAKIPLVIKRYIDKLKTPISKLKARNT